MSNQIDSPKAPSLANLRRVPGDFHSVAKQAPFRIAFRLELGGQNGPKIDFLSAFCALFFVPSFLMDFSVCINDLFNVRTLEISDFT